LQEVPVALAEVSLPVAVVVQEVLEQIILVLLQQMVAFLFQQLGILLLLVAVAQKMFQVLIQVFLQ
jgi:Na+-transporting NADH:ubiquinone oxidoreductase subunit NqrE